MPKSSLYSESYGRRSWRLQRRMRPSPTILSLNSPIGGESSYPLPVLSALTHIWFFIFIYGKHLDLMITQKFLFPSKCGTYYDRVSPPNRRFASDVFHFGSLVLTEHTSSGAFKRVLFEWVSWLSRVSINNVQHRFFRLHEQAIDWHRSKSAHRVKSTPDVR